MQLICLFLFPQANDKDSQTQHSGAHWPLPSGPVEVTNVACIHFMPFVSSYTILLKKEVKHFAKCKTLNVVVCKPYKNHIKLKTVYFITFLLFKTKTFAHFQQVGKEATKDSPDGRAQN